MKNKHHQAFLDKRRRLHKAWYWIGPLCLLFVLCVIFWIYLRSPLLVNPFEVASQIENNTLESSLSSLMAATLPIMVLVCFGLVIAMIVFVHVVFLNERKYLEIINDLNSSQENGD